MTEFERKLIRHLIDGFEAALRVPEPVQAAEAEGVRSPAGRGPMLRPATGGHGDLPGPEELALYIVIQATRSEDNPDGLGGPPYAGVPAVRLRESVYFAGEDRRIGVLRQVKSV